MNSTIVLFYKSRVFKSDILFLVSYTLLMNTTLFFQNIFPLLMSGVSFILIGILWYSPAIFGDIWQKELGLKKDKNGRIPGMNLAVAGSFVLSLVMANILNYFITIMGLTEVLDALMLAFVLWIGFVATTTGINVLYQRKSVALFLVDAGFQLVIMLAFALILVVL